MTKYAIVTSIAVWVFLLMSSRPAFGAARWAPQPQGFLVVTATHGARAATESCVGTATSGWNLLKPCDGDEVAQNSTLIGTYPRTLKHADIWIFEQVPSGIFNPVVANPCRPVPVATASNGYFEQRIRVGEASSTDVGSPFKLLVVTVAQGGLAEQRIKTYLLQFCARRYTYGSGSTIGISRNALPPGVTMQVQITVTRSSDLFGPPPLLPVIPTGGVVVAGNAHLPGVVQDTVFPHQQTVIGTYSGLATGETVWLLVFAPDGRWYPQSTNPCSNQYTSLSYGKWQVSTSLGNPAVNTGQAFYLVPVVADRQATQALEQNVMDGECGPDGGRAVSYSALKLPRGLKETDQPVRVCLLTACKTADNS